MHFLVIDPRFGTPIYVFLLIDPRESDGYPGLPVREVMLTSSTPPDPSASLSRVGRCSVGQDPTGSSHFREFRSEAALIGAGFSLIEPLYVGPTWQAYAREYRPQGSKLGNRRSGVDRKPQS